ncbi:MAG: AAA family ATPase [Candidatus Omnitrophota bacterium]|jgi:DNA-binding NtrC family response regulator|nr:MAG: AAA family ATPase [Candidatus Omnitrophota bacterium]
MNRILLAWIGITDIRAAAGELGNSLGPIGQAVVDRSFGSICLLSDHDQKIGHDYVQWLKGKTSAEIQIQHTKLSSPTHFGEIYEVVLSAISHLKNKNNHNLFHLTYHLSPGTPAMAAVWILVSKTSHPAELIESSPGHGVKTVSFPFDISADYLPELSPKADDEIIRLTQGLPPEAVEFDAIVHRCKEMKRLIARSRRVAVHEVPVLIQGESGTGKELLARAIHASSQRPKGPFVSVNCGAIPFELFEAEFFGHTKGAFTGASHAREGYLESANGGTLFLDEIGELPVSAQVKLLRALQEGIFQKIGSTKSIQVNVRIITATNRNLLEQVAAGRFRGDLFHRLAVGVLQLPPLRERKGDLNVLIDHILARINRECSTQAGWRDKNISASARNLMHQHPWPGNIRELFNALSRAVIWSPGDTIQTEDIQEALLPVSEKQNGNGMILNRNLGEGLKIGDILGMVSQHYLKRALAEANGNKTLAAKLVGLPNYQTFSNWMKKYGVEN